MAQGRQTVQPFPATPPIYSLLGVAGKDTADRWQAGIQFTPDETFDAQAQYLDADCVTPALNTEANHSVLQTADPFLSYSKLTCSTFGFEAADYEGRVRRQLASNLSALIAHEFQLGAIRDAQNLGNVALKDAIILDGNLPVDLALAELEYQMATGWFNGRQAFIYVDEFVFTLLKGAYLIDKVGQLWQTASGNVVIADAGFQTDAVGSDADGHWLYASLPIEVYTDKVFLNPGSFPEAMREAVDRATNTVTIRGEQLALVKVQGTNSNEPGEGTSESADLILKIELESNAALLSS